MVLNFKTTAAPQLEATHIYKMFSSVCFQMDLKLLLIPILLGVFCCSNAQKGKNSQSHLIQDWFLYCILSLWC